MGRWVCVGVCVGRRISENNQSESFLKANTKFVFQVFGKCFTFLGKEIGCVFVHIEYNGLLCVCKLKFKLRESNCIYKRMIKPSGIGKLMISGNTCACQ